MKTKKTVITRKRRGPPPTGKGTLIGVRFQPGQLSAIDAWVGRHKEISTRPEAIRRLVEIGLGTPNRKPGSIASSRAEDLAAEVIDSRMASDATTEQRQSRKRRLVEGPSSFRDVRKDHPR